MAVSQSFITKLAAKLGADPATLGDFLNQWAPWEGSKASYNPLATTQDYQGSTNFNSTGVKNYPSEDAGVDATYQTITNGYYPNLVKGLQTGQIDPQAVAPEIKKWGTTGFANQLEGGGGAPLNGAAPSNVGFADSGTSANSDIVSSVEKRIQDLQDKLDALDTSEPTTNDNGEHDDWAAEVTLYGNQLNSQLTRYTALTGQKDTAFANKLSEQQAKLAYDQTNLSKSSQEIDRFLSGQQESRQRAQLQLQAQEDAMKYGTTGGKTSFSANDLGGVFGTWGSLLGIGNDQSLIKYPGYTTLDPYGDMATMDAQSGVTGQIPQTPSLVSTPAGIPSASTPYGGSPAQTPYLGAYPDIANEPFGPGGSFNSQSASPGSTSLASMRYTAPLQLGARPSLVSSISQQVQQGIQKWQPGQQVQWTPYSMGATP